jgi:hypothetical protein
VIVVATLLLLVALGLLGGGLARGSAPLLWGSFAASALAALVLAVGELRRRRGGAPSAVPLPPSAHAPAARRPAAGLTGPTSASADTAELPAVETVVQRAVDPAQDDIPPVRTTAHPDDGTGPATGAHAAVPALGPDGEPPVEEVEVTDLLLVLDLTDEVLVVDEHPRYHVAGCSRLAGVETIPIPMDEARSDGFTPCGTCAPDRSLARRERARRSG